LHLRSRLVSLRSVFADDVLTLQFMSIVFDCFWWWRAEFGAQSNPYTNKDESEAQLELVTGVDRNTPAPALTSTVVQPWMTATAIGNGDVQNPFTNFDTFPDWDWAAGFDFPDASELNLPVIE
jgi:transcriptional regulatory protein LEU3